MPNDDNKIILEFPATNVEIELGETITFDNISGFLDSERVTYNGDSLTEIITHLEDDKADTTYVNTELANKMNKANPTGTGSIAVGSNMLNIGSNSQTFGSNTKALGNNAFATGENTQASVANQFVFGKYNQYSFENLVEIVGNGTSESNRSNARTLDWSGNETLAGDLTYNGNKSLTSEISRLDGKIDNLPSPMIFKGTLGVGGTIQSLPDASASNEGYTYKVITDGTYAGQTAKVGDVFTSNGSAWVLIPSGDEDNDTWRAIKVNGTEELGSGISSGSVDFVGSENIEIEYDGDGKIKTKTKNIYTKEEVDDIVYGILPDDTASGGVANFTTSLELPIKSLEADVNAVQDLHGQSGAYPSGGQLWDEDWEVGTINNQTGENVNDSGMYRSKNYIQVPQGENLYLFNGNSDTIGLRFYDSNKAFLGARAVLTSKVLSYGTNDLPTDTAYIRFVNTSTNVYLNNISINYPATDTAYHPYSNICPISGVSEINLYKLGGNFFNKNIVTNGKLINGSGNEVSYADWNISDFIPVIEGASYYLYGLTTHPNTNQDNFELFDENKNKVGYANVKTNEQPYVIPSGVAYIKCCVKNQDLNTAQLGVSVNTSFAPYNPTLDKYVIDLGGTYYGGHFTQDKDGHRQFVATHEYETNMGQYNYAYVSASNCFRTTNFNKAYKRTVYTIIANSLCSHYGGAKLQEVLNQSANDSTYAFGIVGLYNGSVLFRNTNYSDATAFKSSMQGVTMTFELETPIIIDLPDGEPITTLVGTNNIFADTGDCAVEYKCSVAEYVANHSGGGGAKSLGGVFLGGSNSGSEEEPTEESEETEKTKEIDEPKEEPKEEVKEIGEEPISRK